MNLSVLALNRPIVIGRLRSPIMNCPDHEDGTATDEEGFFIFIPFMLMKVMQDDIMTGHYLLATEIEARTARTISCLHWCIFRRQLDMTVSCASLMRMLCLSSARQ